MITETKKDTSCHECVTERFNIDNEIKKSYLKVIIELWPEALVQLGKDINKWEELLKQKEKQVQKPWGSLEHSYYKNQDNLCKKGIFHSKALCKYYHFKLSLHKLHYINYLHTLSWNPGTHFSGFSQTNIVQTWDDKWARVTVWK